MCIRDSLDPLLARPALVVEGDDPLGRSRQIGDDEADARIKLARVPLDLRHHAAWYLPALRLIAEVGVVPPNLDGRATDRHIIAPATAVVLRPHELIMRQDDPATAFFIVIDGWVKLYRNNQSGDETVIEIMTKGQSFAEAVAFTGNRYMATAEAVS